MYDGVYVCAGISFHSEVYSCNNIVLILYLIAYIFLCTSSVICRQTEWKTNESTL